LIPLDASGSPRCDRVRICRVTLAVAQASADSGVMSTRRGAHLTPDLFTSLPTAKASEQPTAPDAMTVERVRAATRPKHLLPKDLAGALAWLGDAELDSLLAAVTAEAKRRGRLPSISPREHTANTRSSSRPVTTDADAGALTTGQLNAVRAAFKAGVKPSIIARQFRISQSEVRRALAAERRDEKRGR
jgi:hypothetical protein